MAYDNSYCRILKSLSPARDVPNLSAVADNIIICTDANQQQTRKKIQGQTEASDNLISKIGTMCQSIQAIVEQTKNLGPDEAQPISPNFIEQINQLIDRTNNDSTKYNTLGQTLEKEIENTSVSLDKLLTSHKEGSMTSDELFQKVRDRQEKVKSITETNPDSAVNQLATLSDSLAQNAKLTDRQQKEVNSIMGRHNIVAPTETDRLQGSNVAAPAASERSSAPTESGHRSPGTK